MDSGSKGAFTVERGVKDRVVDESRRRLLYRTRDLISLLVLGDVVNLGGRNDADEVNELARAVCDRIPEKL